MAVGPDETYCRLELVHISSFRGRVKQGALPLPQENLTTPMALDPWEANGLFIRLQAIP
jgi:hypothetical protein